MTCQMTEFEHQVYDFEQTVIADLSQIKTDLRWLLGNGQPGRIQKLEQRVERHEAVLQRGAGIAAAAAGLLTLIHIFIDYFRMHRP